ncbi:hypothetical protein BaRGS_00028350 [Batillaria attramentaria]|uniref:Uncharacterized protein n=1 Tax=Batillaria attramentaria TaxID=370345 RepID=A0ABD0K091_9CAEN
MYGMWPSPTLTGGHPPPSAHLSPHVTAHVTSGIGPSLLPNALARSPYQWSKDDVRSWLEFCSDDFSIEHVRPEKFDMNGKALCLLTRKDFMERDPASGDLLFNALQRVLQSKNEMALHSHISGLGPAFPHAALPPAHNYKPPHVPASQPNGIILFAGSGPYANQVDSIGGSALSRACSDTTQSASRTAPFVPILPQPPASAPHPPGPPAGQGILSVADHKPAEVPDPMLCERTQQEPVENGFDCRLLWEFIYQLLQDRTHRNFVCWEGNGADLVFRIVNPTGLAELWGQQKNRTNMTYEKLSRALRYYYKMNIIKKVPGKRLTYKFLQHPSKIQKGQRGAKPHCMRNLPPNPPQLAPNPPSPSPGQPTSGSTPRHSPVDSRPPSLSPNPNVTEELPRTTSSPLVSMPSPPDRLAPGVRSLPPTPVHMFQVRSSVSPVLDDRVRSSLKDHLHVRQRLMTKTELDGGVDEEDELRRRHQYLNAFLQQRNHLQPHPRQNHSFHQPHSVPHGRDRAGESFDSESGGPRIQDNKMDVQEEPEDLSMPKGGNPRFPSPEVSSSPPHPATIYAPSSPYSRYSPPQLPQSSSSPNIYSSAFQAKSFSSPSSKSCPSSPHDNNNDNDDKMAVAAAAASLVVPTVGNKRDSSGYQVPSRASPAAESAMVKSEPLQVPAS